MNVKDTTTAKSNLQNKSVLKVCRSGELNSPCRYGEVSVSMKILKWRTTQNDAQYQIPGAYPVMVVQVYINRLIYPVQNGMSMMDTEWHGRHVFLIIFKSKFLWIENI
jgi:hypothetical protein